MKAFEASRFMRLSAALTLLEKGISQTTQATLTQDARQSISNTFDGTDVRELGLTTSAKTIRKLLRLCSNEKATYQELRDLAIELRGRLFDEMEETLLLSIDSAKAPYYTQEKPFGEQVSQSFPSTVFDTEEAAKCLALNRSTAAVFHLMRVLEAGLNALADDLGVSFNRTNWQTIIDRIEKEIKKRQKAGPGPKPTAAQKAAWKSKIEFYAEAAVQFAFLKDAWRNRTQHVGAVYTEEKAESIFGHVRTFMQDLARGLS